MKQHNSRSTTMYWTVKQVSFSQANKIFATPENRLYLSESQMDQVRVKLVIPNLLLLMWHRN